MGHAHHQLHAAATPADEHTCLCAYNAALGELGLRFRWDETILREFDFNGDERQAIARYLAAHQAYLLKAYEPEFLSQLIVDKKNQRIRTGRELPVF
jgi:hypothetical protein